MLKDITIGQYFPGDSIVHKLDPRSKIIATFIFIIALFMVDVLWAYSIVIGFVGLTIYLSKVPYKYILKGVKPLKYIILFTFLINLFMTRGEVLTRFWIFTITYEGLDRAMFMALRIIFLIIGTSMMTLTTSPIALTDGIESLLNPLKKIGVPAHELAMMMTIALRFIPTLLEETDKIMKAQKARGADFETGSLIKRAKNLIPLLVPLFVSAFRRAEELAMAMEARCYRGGEGRTRMKQLMMQKKDHIAVLITLLFAVSLISIRVVF